MSELQEGFGEQSKGQFWTVKNGLLCKRVNEGTEGSVQQKKEDGTVYFEIQKRDFTGRLKKVDVRSHEEYGKFLRLHFVAKGESVNIEMKFDSGYAFGFLSTIPSAKIDGLILIAPFYSEKDGKKETKVFIKDETCEGKKWCPQYFTKEHANGLPQLEKVTFKGKESWDNSKRLDYFENTLIPKLNAGLEKIWGSAPVQNKIAPVSDEFLEEAKLPF